MVTAALPSLSPFCLCARSSSFSSSSSSSSSPFLPSAPAFYSSYRVRGRRVWRDTPLRRTIRHTMANRTKPCRSVSVASCARNFARFTISGSHPSLYLRTAKAVRECRGERFFLSKSIIIGQRWNESRVTWIIIPVLYFLHFELWFDFGQMNHFSIRNEVVICLKTKKIFVECNSHFRRLLQVLQNLSIEIR